jgi:hypothetical protein
MLLSNMPFKWSNDLSIQLIESYKTFECLWNPTHMKYKCRNEKHDAWAKLCETTGTDEAEVKRKMKNLIVQFYRERKKYHVLKKSGAGASFVSKWFAYNYMIFFADKNKPQQCPEKGLFESEMKLVSDFLILGSIRHNNHSRSELDTRIKF